jgi:hypothetical protein
MRQEVQGLRRGCAKPCSRPQSGMNGARANKPLHRTRHRRVGELTVSGPCAPPANPSRHGMRLVPTPSLEEESLRGAQIALPSLLRGRGSGSQGGDFARGGHRGRRIRRRHAGRIVEHPNHSMRRLAVRVECDLRAEEEDLRLPRNKSSRNYEHIERLYPQQPGQSESTPVPSAFHDGGCRSGDGCAVPLCGHHACGGG